MKNIPCFIELRLSKLFEIYSDIALIGSSKIKINFKLCLCILFKISN